MGLGKLFFLADTVFVCTLDFYTFVLVSAGTELTLFLVAGTVLGFGFSVRIMLITQ